MRPVELFGEKRKITIVRNILILVSVFCLALLLSGSIMEARPTYSTVHTDGKLIKNVQGETVPVYGTNIGSTLHNEHYMNKWFINGANANNWKTILNTLVQRFGPTKTEALLTDFRAKHLKEDDIRYIRNYLGATVVRLPVYYQWLEDDDNPFVYKQSGWDAIDAIIDWAETHKLYVILHMQGVPGGQNANWNHNGGSEPIKYKGSLVAGLWVDLDKENNGSNEYNYTERTVALWKAIAKRYKGRVGVFGYNLMNEPHVYPPDANGQEDYQLRNQLYRKLYKEIRSVDPDHIIIMESFRTNNGQQEGNGWLATLPNPRAEGWTNVVYSDSMYYSYNVYMNGVPGLTVPVASYFQKALDAFNVPFYVNQITPTQWKGRPEPYGSTDPWDYLDKILGDFNAKNWGWGIWTYKIREPNEQWGIMVRQKDPKEYYIDVGAQSYEELIDRFKYEETSNNYSADPNFVDILRLHSDPLVTTIPAVVIEGPVTPNKDGYYPLKWSEAGEGKSGIRGYQIQESTDGGRNWQVVGFVRQNQFTVTEKPKGNYQYRIRTQDWAKSWSEWSNVVKVQVLNTAPIVRLTAPDSVKAGERVSFDGSATRDVDGTIVSYKWIYGDGQTGEGITSGHVYKEAGTYTVTLEVTDDKGGIGKNTLSITVVSAKPIDKPTKEGIVLQVKCAGNPDGSDKVLVQVPPLEYVFQGARNAAFSIWLNRSGKLGFQIVGLDPNHQYVLTLESPVLKENGRKENVLTGSVVALTDWDGTTTQIRLDPSLYKGGKLEVTLDASVTILGSFALIDESLK